jgi:uncharacterized membrane protein (UPF0127 family)
LQVWVADTPAERSEGLRDLSRLPAGIDGMLFVFPEPSIPTFVMDDTLIPLDVWFFDRLGSLIGVVEMQPCPDGGCPGHRAPGPVGWALETPAGAPDFAPGDLLLTSATP